MTKHSMHRLNIRRGRTTSDRAARRTPDSPRADEVTPKIESFNRIRKSILAVAASVPMALVGFGSLASAGTTQAVSTLSHGQELTAGQQIESSTGNLRLVLQSDGNLVLYSGSRAVWATRTDLPGREGTKLAMQSDGNLVLYHGNTPVWATRTENHADAYLVVQSDGNLVLYSGGRALWATATESHEGGGTPVAAAVHHLGVGNPAGNMAPSNAFLSACLTPGQAAQCNSVAVSAINAARAGEGVGPMVLPGGWDSWSTTSQLVWVFNSERSSRGLSTASANGNLDGMAWAAAEATADPTGPAGYDWDSIMSDGFTTALAADYVWMYDDGPGGPNIDCRTTGASGCWGHREAILNQFGGETYGAAAVQVGPRQVLTGLFVRGY